MPLRNDIGERKRRGVVYTPRWVVDEILSRVCGGGLRGRLLCDPACGDGNFLVAAAEQIISEKGERKRLKKDLQDGICGFDSDPDALRKCRARLDAVAWARGVRAKINWNLREMDSVDKNRVSEYFGAFDFVVGNPPYIRIQHLPKETRARLAAQWRSAARGCCDIYMAFFEAGLRLLHARGKLGYITPNGFAKTDAGKPLREMLSEEGVVKTLIDFGEHQVFSGATTYSLITILDRNANGAAARLYRYDGAKIRFCDVMRRGRLRASRWDLCGREEYARVRKIRERGAPLGEIADIYVGVQTLADDVFILEHAGEDGDLFVCGTADGEIVRLEKAATLPILKVSVMKNGSDPKNRIIVCPYRLESSRMPSLIPEDEMRARFPRAFAYLRRRKRRLLMRDKGAFRGAWYAYGREINLRKTLGDKILTAGMNRAPNFMKCPAPRYTFYSGYAVKIKNAAVSSDELLAQLNSDDMDFFIRRTARDYRNGWKSYAKAFIKDFGVAVVRDKLCREPFVRGGKE
ncbi:MAG: HsdM family class I SAM-dependent methyltransferase [Gammaproteobacteria bacterium]